MSMPKWLLTLVFLVSSPLADAQPRLGKPAAPALVSQSDISIPPSGLGLPPGQGSAKRGQQVFEEKCLACHGEEGKGSPADRLTGGIGTITSAQPVKTVASYWPYATTLFDYVRRAMPINAPRSLTNDEVYAICAYLLSIDGIVPKNAVLDAKSLALVRMPNRDGFVQVWRVDQ